MEDPDNTVRKPAKWRWGLVLFGVIWTLLSCTFVGVGIKECWKALRVGLWETVPCEIERFEITDTPSGDPAFTPDLRFRYRTEGRTYVGTKLWPEKKGSNQYVDLVEIRDEFSGIDPECRVNPDDPREASLMGSSPSQVAGGLFFTGLGAFFTLIGIALTIGGISRKGDKSRRVSEKGTGKGAGLVVSLVFGFVGLLIFAVLVIPKSIEWVSMRGWQEIEAEILWSRVRSKRSDDTTTYAVDLFYRYEMNGREYRSNRYALVNGSSSGRKAKRKIVDAHPRGSKLTVYVDPAQPRNAVVRRNPGWLGLLGLLPLAFVVMGLFGVRWYVRNRDAGDSISSAVREPEKREIAGRSAVVSGEWTRAGKSKFGAFIAISLFALVWNGVVGIFVTKAFKDFGEGTSGVINLIFSGGVALFMIPFALIGLLVALLSVYQFVAIFGPSYEVRISTDELRPGGSTAIHWRRAGGMSQPRDFKLVLTGVEEIDVTRNSKPRSLRSLFYEQVLFDTTTPIAMKMGRAEVRIPGELLPTFMGERHRVRWFVSLRAAVPRLPDLKDEIEIHVRPLLKEELS